MKGNVMELRYATLMMESRGLAPHVRSGGFSESWSRLYRTDDYFIDITWQQEGHGGVIRGQVLSADGKDVMLDGQVALQDTAGQKTVTTYLDGLGQFHFQLRSPLPQQLAVTIDHQQMVIDSVFSR
jgi:hypothetical protein